MKKLKWNIKAESTQDKLRVEEDIPDFNKIPEERHFEAIYTLYKILNLMFTYLDITYNSWLCVCELATQQMNEEEFRSELNSWIEMFSEEEDDDEEDEEEQQSNEDDDKEEQSNEDDEYKQNKTRMRV